MAKKRKLKIGVVIDQLLTGGVQLAAIEQVKHLRILGHNAHLLILMRKKYATDFAYLAKKVPHQFLSDSYPPFLQKPIKLPIFSFLSTLHLLSPVLAPRIIKEKDYDILVSHGTTTCLTTLALWRMRKIPYLAIVHDPMVYILEKCYSHTSLRYFFSILKPLAKLVENSFVKEAKETLIDSKVHFSYIQKNYGLEPKILPLGCKTLTKPPQQRGDYLLSFGRWQKEKNPQFLLELIKNLPEAKLIIAGSWTNQEDFQEFKKRIKQEKLGKRVRVIPHFTTDELKKLCAQSRLWLHPHFEAFSLAGLEAAGHGLPIIIPEKSGVTEIFKHRVHGFFPKKIELREYKKYVKRLLADERQAYKMGTAAYQVVKKKYSWEANSKKLLAIIKKCLLINQKSKIAVLETGRSKGTSLAGGDKLMEPMAVRLANQCQFTIIVPKIGAQHWLKAPLEKEMKILPQNRFDKSGSPVPVFLTYCLRMWQTYQILKNQPKVEILYSSTNVLPDILPAYFAKKKQPQITWIARIHHLTPPPHKREGRLIVNLVSYLMQILALWMIKNKADVIIALNKSLKRKLLKAGFPRIKLTVLGAGIEFEKIARFKPAGKTAYEVVFLGRLHPAKGIFDTIPIWQEVIRKLPQAKLAIIGKGPTRIKKELKKEIKKANLSKNIKVLGFLPYSEIFTIMKNASLFLFLDHEAGWGLAVAEAMACGLPVIGYDIGVLNDVFQKGFITVPSFNKLLFAEKIIDLLANKARRQKLAKLALTQAKRLDWDYTTRKFSQILKA